MKILLDTNIVLDFILKIEQFYLNSSEILKLAFNNKIEDCISASTITDIYYILRKYKSKKVTKELITDILDFIETIDVNKEIISNALKSEIEDFEDAVQENSAIFSDIELIVTRNKNDFKNSILKIYSPEEFIVKFKSLL